MENKRTGGGECRAGTGSPRKTFALARWENGKVCGLSPESRDLWKQQIENIHLISSSELDLPGSLTAIMQICGCFL